MVIHIRLFLKNKIRTNKNFSKMILYGKIMSGTVKDLIKAIDDD